MEAVTAAYEIAMNPGAHATPPATAKATTPFLLGAEPSLSGARSTGGVGGPPVGALPGISPGRSFGQSEAHTSTPHGHRGAAAKPENSGTNKVMKPKATGKKGVALVGQRFAKQFPDGKMYTGTVDLFWPTTPAGPPGYTIAYDDGFDFEDMPRKEVTRGMELHEMHFAEAEAAESAAKKRRKRKRKRGREKRAKTREQDGYNSEEEGERLQQLRKIKRAKSRAEEKAEAERLARCPWAPDSGELIRPLMLEERQCCEILASGKSGKFLYGWIYSIQDFERDTVPLRRVTVQRFSRSTQEVVDVQAAHLAEPFVDVARPGTHLRWEVLTYNDGSVSYRPLHRGQS